MPSDMRLLIDGLAGRIAALAVSAPEPVVIAGKIVAISDGGAPHSRDENASHVKLGLAQERD